MNNVVIIGGGAAGLMAAGTALKNGSSVSIIEKNEKPNIKRFVHVEIICSFGKLFTFFILAVWRNLKYKKS